MDDYFAVPYIEEADDDDFDDTIEVDTIEDDDAEKVEEQVESKHASSSQEREMKTSDGDNVAKSGKRADEREMKTSDRDNMVKSGKRADDTNQIKQMLDQRSGDNGERISSPVTSTISGKRQLAGSVSKKRNHAPGTSQEQEKVKGVKSPNIRKRDFSFTQVFQKQKTSSTDFDGTCKKQLRPPMKYNGFCSDPAERNRFANSKASDH